MELTWSCFLNHDDLGMIFAHTPDLLQLAAELSGEGDGELTPENELAVYSFEFSPATVDVPSRTR
jgi:hypothetical protein